MDKYTALPNEKQASVEDAEREAILRAQVEFQKKLASQKESEHKDANRSR